MASPNFVAPHITYGNASVAGIASTRGEHGSFTVLQRNIYQAILELSPPSVLRTIGISPQPLARGHFFARSIVNNRVGKKIRPAPFRRRAACPAPLFHSRHQEILTAQQVEAAAARQPGEHAGQLPVPQPQVPFGELGEHGAKASAESGMHFAARGLACLATSAGRATLPALSRYRSMTT